METSPPSGRTSHILRFGPFEVNLDSGELRKRGIRVALQEQPLRILAALLEEPGAIVSREELCRRLWPRGTFVDFEHSLNAAVRRLRVTLCDEAGVPRFVETVHRRGYRFMVLNDVLRSAPMRPARVRLAVMPFAVFTGDAVAQYPRDNVFGEGLTDETITQLARVCPARVGVIARTSIARLRDWRRFGAAEIGRELGADYLVEGSIRGEGNRVRITAQLIESEEETHLWAASYDRIVTDALTVQTEVAEAIAREVTARLEPALGQKIAS
jgi:TolB-like protein/DNA-binding winged helix-turn-helix (wHTH) protein